MTPTAATGPNTSLPAEGPFSFQQLIACEEEQLGLAGSTGGGRRLECQVSDPGPAEEPWLVFTNRDRVGLALSGGGIRSATFNLGFLQALQDKNLLGLVDYVATVSGGGYVGGFWTAWRLHSAKADPTAALQFPEPTPQHLAVSGNPASLRDGRERPEIRHLREFSRFLMPRLGLFEVEMWNGVVAVLGGLMPSLSFAIAFAGGAWLLWLLMVAATVSVPWLVAGVVMAAATLGIHQLAERAWHAVHPAEAEELGDDSVRRLATLAAVLSAGLLVLLRWLWLRIPANGSRVFSGTAGIAEAAGPWIYAAAAAWGIAGGLLLAFRFIHLGNPDSREPRLYFSRALDRTIARCLAPALVWAGLGLLWQLAVTWSKAGDRWIGEHGGVTGGAAVGLGATFALLRRWLETSVKDAGKSGLLDRLKPLLPQWIANVTVVVFFLFLAQLLVGLEVNRPGMWLAAFAVCAGLVFLILKCLDPARIGLHDFYRSRIARCFLGAANPDALRQPTPPDYNRQTHERRRDDFTLGALQDATLRAAAPDARGSPLPLRPIHLVCCAANHLNGDPLSSLYRGARSAVVSQRGLSLGDQTRQLPALSFAAALTASASAFNSQMGAISMSLGPAVTFLMVALNLRLGLWLPHPGGNRPMVPTFPGRLFLCELFGWTNAAPPSGPDTTAPDYVHLSDGAHFENFGFYELIRRHCRYVILCDCGADPENTFDDFATSLRRVREDFGVEVEIDFAPLRPGPNGLSAQHVAVGTIHYDGLGGADKGTLLYVKPVLTGDEPCDVAQYRTLNPEFPQQTTADQFYDEAQWESYRRLGMHAGHVLFRFADEVPRDHRMAAERVFFRASRLWKPGWRDSSDELLALAQRAASLEAAIRDGAPPHLRAEFFPEVFPEAAVPPPSPDEEARTLFYLMQVAQLMEDAWSLCHLGTEAQHPVNEGWMAYISRWAVTPSLRRWWPLLASMYCYDFRKFLGSRFQLGVGREPGHPPQTPPRLTLHPVDRPDPAGMAWREWTHRGLQFAHQVRTPSEPAPQRQWFELRFEMAPLAGQATGTVLQVGFVPVERFSEDDVAVARLAAGDFFIPDALHGCGFIDVQLDALIGHFKSGGEVREMRVTFDTSDRRRDPNSRLKRVHWIGFFKSRHFAYRRRPGAPAGSEIEELSRDLRDTG
ncbi:MAG: patatin-like phospholipase family protein [Verrucomicrobiae bacterium]|nr:patatin-like phospholipase family protein [Verrucomicrobiae bacterium]